MVYFITDGTDSIKIGKARSPSNRIKELQCGNPRKLKIIATIKTGSDFKDTVLEGSLHDKFSQYCLYGNGGGKEWFESPMIYRFLKRHEIDIAQELGISPQQIKKYKEQKPGTDIWLLNRENALDSYTCRIIAEHYGTIEELIEHLDDLDNIHMIKARRKKRICDAIDWWRGNNKEAV